MGVWQGVAMDSLKFHPGPPCQTLLIPAGGSPLKLPYNCFRSGPPCPEVIFYPLRHPAPYPYVELYLLRFPGCSQGNRLVSLAKLAVGVWRRHGRQKHPLLERQYRHLPQHCGHQEPSLRASLVTGTQGIDIKSWLRSQPADHLEIPFHVSRG
jgi:hypothetical protein